MALIFHKIHHDVLPSRYRAREACFVPGDLRDLLDELHEVGFRPSMKVLIRALFFLQAAMGMVA